MPSSQRRPGPAPKQERVFGRDRPRKTSRSSVRSAIPNPASPALHKFRIYYKYVTVLDPRSWLVYTGTSLQIVFLSTAYRVRQGSQLTGKINKLNGS